MITVNHTESYEKRLQRLKIQKDIDEFLNEDGQIRQFPSDVMIKLSCRPRRDPRSGRMSGATSWNENKMFSNWQRIK